MVWFRTSLSSLGQNDLNFQCRMMCTAFAICLCCNVKAKHICFISLSTVPELYVLCERKRNLFIDHVKPHIPATYHIVCAGLNYTHKTLLVFPNLNTIFLKNDYFSYTKTKKGIFQNFSFYKRQSMTQYKKLFDFIAQVTYLWNTD